LKIDRTGQVWATDITYVQLAWGFMCLVAIIDWYSRKVLSWRISNTMDTDFCVDALEEAQTEKWLSMYIPTTLLSIKYLAFS